MQIIETKYHGPTNTKGSKVSATASGCKARVTLSWDNSFNSEDNHKRAALALMEKLDWIGKYVGGHTQRGMVFVCADDRFSYHIER